MSASGGANMPTDFPKLPRLELNEPTLLASIIEVHLPWLFWVQRQSRHQELEDIMESLE